MSEAEPSCARCGARGDLVPDPELEGIWYCRRCKSREDEHQAIIEHGYDDEEPQYE